MSPEQFVEIMEEIKKQIKHTTETAVEVHVNGKVKALVKQVEEYIAKDEQWKKEDKTWKEGAQPVVNLGMNTINFWNVMRWILLTGASLAGFLLAIRTINGLFK